jgi:ATP-binding cassette subfamily B protein
MLISAFAEAVSLGAVLPFLGVIVDPERVFNWPIVSSIAENLGIESSDQLVLPLTIAFATAALAAGTIRIILLWASTRVAFATGADLGFEVYRRTLYQPYPVHVARNSSEVISGIVVKVNGVAGMLLSLLNLISSTVLLITIMVALFTIDPEVASFAALGFGASYAIISLISRKRLHSNSMRLARERNLVVKALQEGLGGIRDILLDGSQAVYCANFGKADRAMRRAEADTTFIGQSPRFAIEAVGMVLIAFLAYGLSREPGGIAEALPILGALAFGAQRLLPSVQQIFAAWASIAGNRASLADALELLNQPLPTNLLAPAPSPMAMESRIRFDAVRFRYTNDTPWVINGLDLIIPKGASVGFVGSTGSGKSTALDLLMGLLYPTEGEIWLDDIPISGAPPGAWQRSIAHVPQSIFLADATVAENIAFGVRPDAIDLDRVKYAAGQAQIAGFIEGNSKGYQAFVGERGVRLSGGQRQRIGIARALYKRASVLVLDEATSALDSETEKAVMGAIEGLSGDLTVAIIAHRLSTIKECSMIVELENGRMVAQGTFDELMESSPTFRKKAGGR